MKRFRNLLVMAGGKDSGVAAVAQAVRLATLNPSAKVTIVDCVEPLSNFLDFAGTEAEINHKRLVDQRRADLESLAQSVRKHGVKVAYSVVQGDPSEKIIERVLSEGHDLLIKSAEQPAGLVQRLFGTVGQRLMRKCPCPVWIIKTPARQELRRILVAVDPVPVNEKRVPMNLKIMELGVSLANADAAELHVVYVWPHWSQRQHSLLAAGEGKAQKVDRDAPNLQEAILEQLVGRFRGQHDLTTHLLCGDAGDVIANLSAKLDADLLVMGTVCRNQFAFFAMGNTAERVLDQVNCSVLSVKPETFLTNLYPQTALGRGSTPSFP